MLLMIETPPPIRVAGLDVPLSYAANHEALSLPSVTQVVQALRDVVGRADTP